MPIRNPDHSPFLLATGTLTSTMLQCEPETLRQLCELSVRFGLDLCKQALHFGSLAITAIANARLHINDVRLPSLLQDHCLTSIHLKRFLKCLRLDLLPFSGEHILSIHSITCLNGNSLHNCTSYFFFLLSLRGLSMRLKVYASPLSVIRYVNSGPSISISVWMASMDVCTGTSMFCYQWQAAREFLTSIEVRACRT